MNLTSPTVTIASEEEWDAHAEDLDDSEYVLLAERQTWIAWETEDGDWFAVRPRSADDPAPEEGDRWRPVGPEPLDTIGFPWVLTPTSALTTPEPTR